ncbi:hypothetical protein [Nocardioides taihuensis]|uniref:Twin-arginine translocation signal domain-containing protein n=1 Tax=Nocardioides taihuensis TaxID=1835606 RepID=A0ABW0BJ06_9ACTN
MADHAPQAPRAEISRRSFLAGSAGIVALGASAGILRPQSASAVASAAERASSVSTVSMAMHLHASFSEGIGSMAGHLSQAVATGVDVVWWTEHDWRMQSRGYVSAVGFDGLTETRAGQPKVTLKPESSGSLSTYSGSFVTSPVSGNDPGRASALRLTATSSGTARASRRYTFAADNKRLVGNLDGTTLLLDVLCVRTGAGAWAELRIRSSYLPATGGRSAGQYEVVYLIGGNEPDGALTTSGRNATVFRSAPVGQWTTLVLDPVSDLTRAFGGVDFRDSSGCVLQVGVASSNRVQAEAVFDYLRIERVRKSGDQPLAVQSALMDSYAVRYPGVLQMPGLEISSRSTHVNGFGSGLSIPAEGTPASVDPAGMVAAVHSVAGVASYNHPFGTSGPSRTTTQQDNLRRTVATAMLNADFYAADVLEVGFPGGKAGMSAAQYYALWDTLSRNLLFATGVGTSDDHTGRTWATQQWNHVTRVRAELAEASLLDGLRAGRAWFGPPSGYPGDLDLEADDGTPMGSVSVSTATQRSVRVLADTVPNGGTVTVVRGGVDAAGTTDPNPSVTRQQYAAASVQNGELAVPVDTSSPAFVRVEVADSSGNLVAASNPVWLLRDLPAGVPAARLPV